jgi:hypothetical protein
MHRQHSTWKCRPRKTCRFASAGRSAAGVFTLAEIKISLDVSGLDSSTAE